MKRVRAAALMTAATIYLAAVAGPTFAVTTGHSETLTVSCAGGTGFTADANAFRGQRAEVSAFYQATGIVCVLKDAAGAVIFDPSA